MVKGLADLIKSTVGSRIDLLIDFAADLPLAKADPNQLEMTILNLSANARDAMPEGGTLTISAVNETVKAFHRAKLHAGQYLHLSISDTGTGMSEETRTRALEPFFSTKDVGKGTGLGLSMAEGLAAQLGGALLLSSTVGVGTTVEIWLPATMETLDAAEPVLISPVGKASRSRVLLVDDEAIVRLSTSDMLEDMGYDVVEASSGEEALLLLQQDCGFDLLISDHVMPGMTGIDLIEAVRRSGQDIPALIITGFANADTIPSGQSRLAKPFRQTELMTMLSHVRPNLSPHGLSAAPRSPT